MISTALSTIGLVISIITCTIEKTTNTAQEIKNPKAMIQSDVETVKKGFGFFKGLGK